MKNANKINHIEYDSIIGQHIYTPMSLSALNSPKKIFRHIRPGKSGNKKKYSSSLYIHEWVHMEVSPYIVIRCWLGWTGALNSRGRDVCCLPDDHYKGEKKHLRSRPKPASSAAGLFYWDKEWLFKSFVSSWGLTNWWSIRKGPNQSLDYSPGDGTNLYTNYLEESSSNNVMCNLV